MSFFGKVIFDNWGLFWTGFYTTISVSVWAAVLSLLLGIVVALLRVTPSGGLKVVAVIYTELFRNTPFLVQTLALYFGLPKLGVRLEFHLFGVEFDQSYVVGTLALALYTGAYVAEVIRSGLLSIPHGQTEAARSLGLSLLQTLQLVILPQAIRLVIPPLGNLFIALVKNSAILASISLGELMFQASLVNNRTFRTFDVFTAVIIFYLILTLPLGWLVVYLEEKLNPLRARKLRLKGASS